MRLIFLILLIILSFCILNCETRQIYRDYWEEAEEIVRHMTLDEKIGQMTQADIGSLNVHGYTDASIIDRFKIGSVLVGGDSCPDTNGNILLEIIGKDYYGATMHNW